jgi:large conductance mechanosensitive channel
MWADFRAFLLKTNAMALAIGIIIGLAFGAVVNSLVNDIIMPPIGMLLGKVDFSQLKWVLQAATDPTKPETEIAIRYGLFINTVIAFVIVAFVVWRLSKMFIREEAPAATQTCPYCKEPNAVDASRCRSCTSELRAPSGVAG